MIDEHRSQLKHLLVDLGASINDVKELSNGLNARVFLITRKKKNLILKIFPCVSSEKRDRFKIEASLLDYCNKVAPSYVPRLIAIDNQNRVLLMEYIKGSTFPPDTSAANEMLTDVSEFLYQLNRGASQACTSINFSADEGCFSLSEHLDCLDSRISQLTTEHMPPKLRESGARALLSLKVSFQNIRKESLKLINVGYVPDRGQEESRWLTPGDIGLHNAIVTNTGVKFFDFEFGGWDDPERVIADFFMHPKNNSVHLDHSNDLLVKKLSSVQLHRLTVLRRIFGVRWMSIILGFMSSERRERLLMVRPDLNLETYAAMNLSLAKYYERSLCASAAVWGAL